MNKQKIFQSYHSDRTSRYFVTNRVTGNPVDVTGEFAPVFQYTSKIISRKIYDYIPPDENHMVRSRVDRKNQKKITSHMVKQAYSRPMTEGKHEKNFLTEKGY